MKNENDKKRQTFSVYVENFHQADPCAEFPHPPHKFFPSQDPTALTSRSTASSLLKVPHRNVIRFFLNLEKHVIARRSKGSLFHNRCVR